MTKKHFIALADALWESEQEIQTALADRPQEVRNWARWQSQVFKVQIARFCKSQNSNFNQERWFAYIAGECGPNGKKLTDENDQTKWLKTAAKALDGN